MLRATPRAAGIGISGSPRQCDLNSALLPNAGDL